MAVAFSPLRIENLFVAYGKADVICGVNMEICAGRITGLLGANGAGKTTLLRAILGLTPPRKGSVVFNGMEISGLPPHKIAARGISGIPEGRRIFSKMTVEENLLMGAYMERDRDKIRQRLERVYRIFPRLLERRGQFAGTMSGGEQAMVSIGRGLMNEPKLLVIDEPSLGLSPALVNDNFRVIRKICEDGIAVFLVEQNVRQTLAIAHYGYVLAQGRVVAEGTAEELKQSEEVKKAYFG
ncbi:ABC transporter ATP-binding protein [uncultured Mailhella sp.]|uniref:ABC transporter ATP-binding protein n=1 Tax=uncultured Mailhella sp. TaxID=1981031 RepID=UPI0025D88FE4|nr:ABC transporter ATP-binding protein [uncultured Mailhella sp.]